MVVSSSSSLCCIAPPLTVAERPVQAETQLSREDRDVRLFDERVVGSGNHLDLQIAADEGAPSGIGAGGGVAERAVSGRLGGAKERDRAGIDGAGRVVSGGALVDAVQLDVAADALADGVRGE